jgi:hypothetical protein
VKKHGAIVVTINYRLAALGWMQVVKGAGNFGLKDQQQVRAVSPFTSGFWVSANREGSVAQLYITWVESAEC